MDHQKEADSSSSPSKSDANQSQSSNGNEMASAATKEVVESTSSKVTKENNLICILSWNIDGLDEDDLVTRTKAACAVIQKENPDVVFLQEVVPISQKVIEDTCPQYQLIQANDVGYYTMMLLSRETVTLQGQEITAFPSSKMSRNMLKVNSTVKGVECLFITSHLESNGERTKERIRQLKSAFKVMSEAEEEKTVLFGGDLNLRDKEVTAVGGLPENVHDLWELTGKGKQGRYTWDLTRNNNKQMPGKYQPMCRFDRLYIQHPKARPRMKPIHFGLVGLERVKTCGRFPSDHWGLLAHFEKI